MNHAIEIESKQSKIISLKSIHEKRADLNSHRKGLLEKVLESGSYEKFPKNHVSIEDLACLTEYFQYTNRMFEIK